MAHKPTESDRLAELLHTLRLPAFAATFTAVASRAEKEEWSYAKYLKELCDSEIEERRVRKIERLLRSSGLPPEKTLSTLDRKRLPVKIAKQMATLVEGRFVQEAENVLLFGGPGKGKTHVAAAIGHELANRGIAVHFVATFKLVQRLLVAKKNLALDAELKRLDRFEVVILDDIGYVQQDRDEMEVLFTFLAERYERRSVMITSNLVFSQWTKIFKDPMTTAAAIDRVVHHATILEFTNSSVRADDAQRRKEQLDADEKGGKRAEA